MNRLDRRHTRHTPTADILTAELAAVTGPRCGWTCPDHHGENMPPCERPPGHTGAIRLADVHVAHDPGGQLVTATECCPAAGVS